jgi:ankyrin repeat protein
MLKCAIYHFRFDIAELLLKYGADPSLVDVGELDATVPLSAAAAAGSDHMVKRLIQAGADATAPGVLHAVAESCELETVKMVVKKGADIFALEEGSTVLHAAVRNNDYRVTAYFLDIGLDTIVSEQKRNGETALWDALYTQNAKTIRLLLDADIDLNVADRFGGTAVHQAALCALPDVVEHMMEDRVRINRGAENNESELHYAVTGGDAYIIQLLIEYGADLNWLNRDGETPLHVAALNGREDIIQQLFTAGADPTLRDIHFRTPYEAAVERGYKESARCLEIPDEFDWS